MFSKIVLASKSPRRQQLLQWAEIPFEVMVSNAEEKFPEGLSPADAAMYIAAGKAEAVTQKKSLEMPVLSADTMVFCDGMLLGKPDNEVQAIRMLTTLSGKKHEVVTGVCIRYKGEEILFADSTYVHFHSLKPSQIAFYVHKYKPYDKAGGYAIQEWIGVVGIKAIEGDFYNVMGLPVSRVVEVLSTLHY